MAKIRIVKNKAQIIHEWRKELIVSVILNIVLTGILLKRYF